MHDRDSGSDDCAQYDGRTDRDDSSRLLRTLAILKTKVPRRVELELREIIAHPAAEGQRLFVEASSCQRVGELFS